MSPSLDSGRRPSANKCKRKWRRSSCEGEFHHPTLDCLTLPLATVTVTVTVAAAALIVSGNTTAVHDRSP